MLTPAVVAELGAEVGDALAVGVSVLISPNEAPLPVVTVSPEWWQGEVCLNVSQALELAGAIFTAIDRIAESEQ